MATKKAESPMTKYPKGSEERAIFLQAGYPDMTPEKAAAITKAFEEDNNPGRLPYEKYEQAQAFLAALNTDPTVVSDTPGWKRKPKRSTS